MVTGGGTGKRGWLEKQEEDGGEWLRRYFVLERRTRDGAHEASIEYYLDDALSPDEDAETIQLGKNATITTLQGAEGGRFAAQLVSETGAMYVLAAPTKNELSAWVLAVEEASKGSFLSEVAASAAAVEGSAQSAASGLLESLASSRSEAASTKLAEASAVPDVSERLHAGWLTKKAPGFMASSQKRYFVLYKRGEIHYFDKEWTSADELARVMGAKGHKGIVELAGVKPSDIARTDPSSAKNFAFTIAAPKRKWQLTAASAAEFDGWKGAITRVIS